MQMLVSPQSFSGHKLPSQVGASLDQTPVSIHVSGLVPTMYSPSMQVNVAIEFILLPSV